jgi:hypothetical protein
LEEEKKLHRDSGHARLYIVAQVGVISLPGRVQNEYARWAVSASILVIGELEEVGGSVVYSGVSVRQPALGGVVRSFARLLFASTPLEVFALKIVRLSDENWVILETSRQYIHALVARCPEAKRVVENKGFCHVKAQGGCEAEDLKKIWWCGTDCDIPAVRKSTR